MLEKSLAREWPRPTREYLRSENLELERKNLQIIIAPPVAEEIKENPFLQTALGDIYEFDSQLSKNRGSKYDFDTYRHSLRTANLISVAAGELKLKPSTIKLLIWAALVHDVGKIKMPPALIAKKGGLSVEEKSVHVSASLNYLKNLDAPEELSDKLKYIVGCHHEKDSYPRSQPADRRKNSRPKEDRRKEVDADTEKAGHLFGIFDKLEALSGRRNYKKIWSNAEIKDALFKVYPESDDQNRIKVLLEKISS